MPDDKKMTQDQLDFVIALDAVATLHNVLHLKIVDNDRRSDLEPDVDVRSLQASLRLSQDFAAERALELLNEVYAWLLSAYRDTLLTPRK